MPELPDVVTYIEALDRFCSGRTLRDVRLGSPFLLRSVTPPLSEVSGRTVGGFRRLGKRIVFEIDGDLFLVLHLMITGRLRWQKVGAKLGSKSALAGFDFDHGTLVLTEAGSKKRASLYLVEGDEALAEHDPGGLEILQSDLTAFEAVLDRENHTLKRTLTDPRLISGIGNSYSDEILHRAGLSPFKQTKNLNAADRERLFDTCREILIEWTERHRNAVGSGFPDKVTAFHPEMAVHGRYGKPCPRCGTAVQRIVYADSEANYCPQCQTGGKLLADRALSQLLKKDWPKTLDELEARKAAGRSGSA